MNRIWFWAALVISGVLGYVSYHFLPDLAALLGDGPLASGYLEILNSSLLVMLAGQVALAALFFSILGLMLPALTEGVALARAKAGIEGLPLENTSEKRSLAVEFETEIKAFPLMAESIPAYARFLVEEDVSDSAGDSKTPRPRSALRAFIGAHHFFGPQIFVDERLSVWLFRPLASLLQAYGLIIFVLAGLLGLHEYREALAANGGALNGAENTALLWAWIEKGLFALSFTSVGALFILLLTKACFGLRKKQVNGFCRFLDHRFHFMPPSAMLGEVVMSSERENQEARKKMQELVAGITRSLNNNQRDLAQHMSQMAETIANKTGHAIEFSLREPLDRLAETSIKISQEQSGLTAEVIKSALQAFLAEMDKELGGQFKKTNAILKSTTLLSGKLEKSFLDAVQHIARESGEQNQAFLVASKEINITLSELKNFEKALGQIVGAVQPALDRVMENQAALLVALTEEKSASKTIGQAAQDMNKAARASKDTVESFITLAEKMKEASRSISQVSKAATLDAASALPGIQNRAAKLPRPEGAEANKLSQALRDLKDKAGSTGKLPRL